MIYLVPAVMFPLFCIMSVLLFLKYRTSVKSIHLILFLSYFWVPFISLGDLVRLVSIPFVVYLVIRKNPSKATVIGYLLFVLIFIVLIVPEQVMRNPYLALIRNLLRYSLLVSGCIVTIINFKRINNHFEF